MTLVGCPIAPCARFKRPQDLMCKAHWGQVPKEIRDDVWIAWRARQQDKPGARERHMAAKARALEAARAAGPPPQLDLV